MERFGGSKIYDRYEQFAIAGEDDQYRLNISGKAVGNARGDELSYHNNQKFSTFDRDNDAWNSGNCASKDKYAGGWWYNSCAGCNLNGKYYNSMEFKKDNKFWDGIISLKTVKMLIRPKSY
ncbi:angiopoietin-related protein 2-like [Drosophila montana]|uniref:angiopoietin-related protein 2-like n=1 Tax=Drosophila montana TaxID=40370 RepID=UPI00313DDB9D